MDSLNFVYWLQGFLELSGAQTLDERQVAILKDHIALVLNKSTPTRMQGVQGMTTVAGTGTTGVC